MTVPLAQTPGTITFRCPCGAVLQVAATDPPRRARCPDCHQVVPVPRGGSEAEAPTEELDRREIQELEAAYARPGGGFEAGARACPDCGELLPLGSAVCIHCGPRTDG